MMPIKVPFFVLGCLLLISCQQSLDEQSFGKWIADYDNGLHVRKTSGDFLIDLQYKPASYMAIQQLRESAGGNFQSAVDGLDDLQYYTLTIGLANSTEDFLNFGVADQKEKQRLLYYYSYLFQDDIKLEDGGQSLPCVLYHFERSADMKNSRTFVIAFENPSKESIESKLIIQSTAIGPLPFSVKISKNNIPTLKI